MTIRRKHTSQGILLHSGKTIKMHVSCWNIPSASAPHRCGAVCSYAASTTAFRILLCEKNLSSRLNYLLPSLPYCFVEFYNFYLPRYSPWLFLSFSTSYQAPCYPWHEMTLPLAFLGKRRMFALPRVNHFSDVGAQPWRLLFLLYSSVTSLLLQGLVSRITLLCFEIFGLSLLTCFPLPWTMQVLPQTGGGRKGTKSREAQFSSDSA